MPRFEFYFLYFFHDLQNNFPSAVLAEFCKFISFIIPISRADPPGVSLQIIPPKSLTKNLKMPFVLLRVLILCYYSIYWIKAGALPLWQTRIYSEYELRAIYTTLPWLCQGHNENTGS
jgi:hypothetical protein